MTGSNELINRAKRVHPDGTVTTYCIKCKWESNKLKSETAFQDLNLGSQIQGLTPFESGYLSGAFNNHHCQTEDELTEWLIANCQPPIEDDDKCRIAAQILKGTWK